MAATPPYRDRPPSQGMRRSFTPLTRTASVHEAALVDESDATAEILFALPSARIYEFVPPSESIKSTSTEKIPLDTDYPVDTIETLPWRSRTETLQAAGPLIIEKVRGSTVFLKCQHVVKAILRNSQCWCVDGESKFVLRIGRLKYYRVELPTQSQDEKQKIEDFKKVLPTVLRYEATPCPFVRAFTVDLPDTATKPRRKGTWKRRDSSQTGLSDSETPSRGSLQSGRNSSLRSPPTSYPRNGPSYGSPSSYSRLGASAGLERLALPNSDSPTRAEHEKVGDNSDDESVDSHGDHDQHDAEEAAEQEDERRGRPQLPRQVSTTVPVSVRVASIERSKEQYIRSPISVKSPSIRAAALADTTVYRDTVSQANDNVVVAVSGALVQQPVAFELQPSDETETKDVESHDEMPGMDVDTASTTNDPMSSQNNSEISTIHLKPDSEQVEIGSLPLHNLESDHELEEDKVADSASSHAAFGAISTPTDSNTVFSTPSEQQVEDIEMHAKETVANVTVPPQILSLEQTPAARNIDAHIVRHQAPLWQPSDQDQFAESSKDGDIADQLEDDSDIPEAKEANQISVPLEEAMEGEQHDQSTSADDGNDDVISVVSSTDSFHTMSSIVRNAQVEVESEYDETPINPYIDPFTSAAWQHRRELSELTVTESSVSDNLFADASSVLGDDQKQAIDDPDSDSASTKTPTVTSSQNLNVGLRQRLRARRSFSPMPPSSIIITNPGPRAQSGRDMAKAVLQTVVVKPIEFTILVIHILTRIVHGATVDDLLSGDLFRRPEHQRRVSGFADQMNGPGDARVGEDSSREDQTDDFNVPIRGRTHRLSPSRNHRLDRVAYGARPTDDTRNHHEHPSLREDDAESAVSVD